jgi:hypothetical protein
MTASLMVAFHAGGVWSEEELTRRLAVEERSNPGSGVNSRLGTMLEQMGKAGRKAQPQSRRKAKESSAVGST